MEFAGEEGGPVQDLNPSESVTSLVDLDSTGHGCSVPVGHPRFSSHLCSWPAVDLRCLGCFVGLPSTILAKVLISELKGLSRIRRYLGCLKSVVYAESVLSASCLLFALVALNLIGRSGEFNPYSCGVGGVFFILQIRKPQSSERLFFSELTAGKRSLRFLSRNSV